MSYLGANGFLTAVDSSDANPFDNGFTASVGTSSPRYSGQQWANSFPFGLAGWNIPNQPKVIQGSVIRRGAQSGQYRTFLIREGGNNQVSLVHDFATKQIKVYRDDQGTLLGTSAVLPEMTIPGGGVCWINTEWEVVINNSTGTINVWTNGGTTPIISLSGIDTQNTANAWADLGLFSYADAVGDIYLLDGAGSAPHNARYGDVRICHLMPDGDDSVQWTPNSGGTNYTQVDDSGTGGQDEDTTYVEDSTVGHIDRYTMANLPSGFIPLAVEQQIVAKKTDVGTREIKMKINSGGTNSDGSVITLTTSYLLYKRIMQVDPTDSAAWTASKVNALKAGMEVVT
jgi:hypothetical protein